jgi:surface antigen
LRWRTVALALGGLVILLSLAAQAAAPHGANCVAYARAVTGIELDGDAGAWWPHAAGRYERGQVPKLGAILVFKPSGHMHVGHVAVVSRVVGPREILVDQANWIPGRVVTAMSVIDASPGNDWTSVKVIELHSGTHGRENQTYGFIYPRSLPIGLAEANTDSSDPHRTEERVTLPQEKGSHEHTRLAEGKAASGDAHAVREPIAKPHDKGRRDQAQLANAKHDSSHPDHLDGRMTKAHTKGPHEHTQLADATPDHPKPDDAKVKRLAKRERHPTGKPDDPKLAYLY